MVDTKRKKGVMKLSNLKRMNELEELIIEIPQLSNPISVVGLVKYSKQAYYNGNPKYYQLPTSQENSFIMSYAKNSSSEVDLLKNFVDSVIPEYMADRTSVSVENNNRGYNLGVAADSYLDVADGGALMGLGVKYSQFNTGQNFKTAQWGCSLESTLTSDNPISVFIFVKAKATLLWSSNGVQMVA